MRQESSDMTSGAKNADILMKTAESLSTAITALTVQCKSILESLVDLWLRISNPVIDDAPASYKSAPKGHNIKRNKTIYKLPSNQANYISPKPVYKKGNFNYRRYC